MKRKLFVSVIVISALLVNSGFSIKTDRTTLNYEYVTSIDTIINFKHCETDKLPDGFTQTATGKPQHRLQ